MGGWRNWYQELVNSKPLFLTIYTTVIVGIVVSSFYVFSSIYSAKSPSSATATNWLSAPSAISRTYSPMADSSHINLAPKFSQAPKASTIPTQTRSKKVKPIWEVPESKSLPSLKSFRLTKELVEERVQDNVIIMTFGNYAFMDFILTWVKHLTDLGLSNILVGKLSPRKSNLIDRIYIPNKDAEKWNLRSNLEFLNIGALDSKLVKALYWKGIPVFDMGSHMSTMDVGWGSPTFHKMGREKAILIDSVLPFGFELLMCDTDMVWLKNPLPYFARYPDADILTSSDQVVPTVVDDRLDIWQKVGAAYNVGIFHWRPTGPAKKLAKEWKEMILADDKIWDQNGFNNLVRRQLGPSVLGESGLAFAYDGNLKLGVLPASIFCSGHTYFVQAMYEQLKLEPYAVHTTFQYAGTDGKRHRLREAKVFYDPPEYYDVPGGFLSFNPSIPKSLLLDGKHNLESHFALVNYQMKQIRTALAIASVLNRTLVMPPLWCRLDRLWFPHPGVLEGTMTRQPFLCPLDHVFEVNVMLQQLQEDEYGPGIGIREYSFFDNPSMRKQVKDSRLEVQLCDDTLIDCHASSNTTSPGILRFPQNSGEETFKNVFSSFSDVKVIHFSSMKNAFLNFTDKTREERFRRRVKRYVGIWCCVDNHTPGHIYYDMYWDEKADWKPMPPQTPEDDHPPW